MIRPVAASLLLCTFLLALAPAVPAQKIHIAFLWHMHQPNYYPGETILETENAGHYDYSVVEIHTTRSGPYTWWPADAVQMGIDAGMPHFGAQVSFTGSLIENLNELENAGIAFQGWHTPWNQMRTASTSLGNPRIDMVGFGYFHPLMGLLWPDDITDQIDTHRALTIAEFSGNHYSNGIFPPENAFSTRMIPALLDAGIDWALVDNIHFDRAAQNYPWSSGGSVVEPNQADVRNPDPDDWVALNDLWAPTPVSALWGHQPHWVEYVDPASGQVSRMVAVPASRYLGNEDGRGGFGALQYDAVMSQLEPYNDDPDHPMLIVLHHDGDNYGGGTDSYYHSNFSQFVSWLQAESNRFECTTIEDYLERFPPDPDDVIHVEPGSWAGADAGDPEFKKWLGDPVGGYSPDINSWGVITAAKHIVDLARAANPNHGDVQTAERYLHMGEASDYWYWDNAQGGIWDTHPTRAANLAFDHALPHIGGSDLPPSIFLPQREPYNPGGSEWGELQSSTFDIWTYVYDHGGVQSVTLKVREDTDGVNDPATTDNETYAGGPDVGAWQTIPMTAEWIEPQTNLNPQFKAHEYRGTVEGFTETWLDYYVVAVDDQGNVQRGPIQHVYVGAFGGGGGSGDDFVMDGTRDESSELLFEDGPFKLWAMSNDTWLYVAATAAPNLGDDVFIGLAEQPGAMQPAMWAKAGQVAAWDLFVGNEAGNNYIGPMDNQSNVQVAAGSVAEVMIPIADEWHADLEGVYLFAARYATNDGDPLTGQLPDGNGNGDIEAAEYHYLEFSTVDAPEPVAENNPSLPDAFALSAAYPNPFNATTTVEVALPRTAELTVTVTDITGRQVVRLAHGRHAAGVHRLTLDGSSLASGVYIVRAATPGEGLASRKIVLVK